MRKDAHSSDFRQREPLRYAAAFLAAVAGDTRVARDATSFPTMTLLCSA